MNLILALIAAAVLSVTAAVAYKQGVNNTELKYELRDKENARKVRETEDIQQSAAIEARKARDATDRTTTAKHLAIVASLRNRPSRPEQLPEAAGHSCPGTSGSGVHTPDGKLPEGPATYGSTGAGLYLEDGEFLAGESSRADRLRTALKECYAVIDAAKPVQPAP